MPVADRSMGGPYIDHYLLDGRRLGGTRDVVRHEHHDRARFVGRDESRGEVAEIVVMGPAVAPPNHRPGRHISGDRVPESDARRAEKEDGVGRIGLGAVEGLEGSHILLPACHLGILSRKRGFHGLGHFS